jgi:prepilin-type N-terminal cleavage/methylation domain-containing protein/prepilin-type processing-associated H-X9-DG protein
VAGAGSINAMKRRKSAFTLIELLVVVSIIALLISILLPSLKRAREQAKRTVCASNMRHLGLAVHMYATANNDRLVTVGQAHGGSIVEEKAWIITLEKEYGNKLLARCPSDNSSRWPKLADDQDELEFRQTSYASNYYTVAPIAGKGPYDRLSLFRHTGGTIYFAEVVEEGPFAASDHVHPENWIINPETKPFEDIEAEQHLKKANYLFIDSHVETLRFKQTYDINYEESTSLDDIHWHHNMWDPEIGR